MSKTYTVVGLWPDTDQRFCEPTDDANTPDEAQAEIAEKQPGLCIVAVFEGNLTPVDNQRTVTYT